MPKLNSDALEVVPPEPESLPPSPPPGEEPLPRAHGGFFRFFQRAQRYSSFSFSAFLAMHAGSVIVAPMYSLSGADSTMQFTRAIYQGPTVEPTLVLGSLAVHVASGLILRAHEVYLNRKYYEQWRFPRLSPVSVSGLVLLPFVVGHYIVVRAAPERVLGDSSLVSLQYIAHIFHKYPLLSWVTFAPLVLLTAHHTIWGYKKWFQWVGKQYRRDTFTLYFATLVAATASLVRIARMPSTTRWLASQFDQILRAMRL